MADITSPELPAIDWHNLAIDETVQRLETDELSGLSAAEAAERLRRVGPNLLPPPPRRSAWLRFAHQFHNVLIYVMLAAAAITLALGHLVDTSVLLAAVIINALIGFIQEGKAEQALDAIRRMLSLHATVVRDGERMEIPAEALVPGDLVVLASGDKVPADLRLVSEKALRVNEAILTGESEVVEKALAPVPAEAALGDRRCMLYSGTLLSSGLATGVVVATGARTELGRIGAMLKEVQTVTTPLLRQIDGFGRWLAIAIVIMAVLTFFTGIVWRGEPASEMFLMAVALAASAIPEGLPAIMTITLALGVQRMARRNAIIRHLPAVEALGSVTVICSDKTGTLTRNEMTVQQLITATKVFEITGVGYVPDGAVHLDGGPVTPEKHPELAHIGRALVLCNDAQLHNREGAWQLEGDPTEGSLLTLAYKLGLHPATERGALPRTDVIPFESQHRLMATLNHDHEGRGFIYVKGSPERIMDMCEWQGDGQPIDTAWWHERGSEAAARGLRILAIAVKATDPAQREVRFSHLRGGFTLMGLVGIIDPPREEAIRAVAECAEAGIRVKMITGDHVETARAIGARMGIGVDKPALTGPEIEVLSDEELRRYAPHVDVFARTSPEHKLRLVEALQAAGHVVAMTGDGVNDAPALKRADVGVAMGLKGNEAAKEAAAMVLTDDNFATISNAVGEGRGIYDNIRKFILFMLPTNGGEALVVITAILFNFVLPLTPAQVLWINMATVSTLGLALAFEPAEEDVMRRPPRDPLESLLSWFFVWRLVMVSLLMATGALGLFLWELEHGASLEKARTIAVSTIVVAEMFYLINSRHILRSVLSRDGLLGNPYVLLAIAGCALLQFAYTATPALQAVFKSTPLTTWEWSRVILAGALVFSFAELEKMTVRWLNLRNRQTSATA
ncbi:MAG: cation-transporting P-type ATPase [Thiohalomonadaceae bacterium]